MAGYIGANTSSVNNNQNAAERRKKFTFTAATTALTGLNFLPDKIHIFHNGIRLVKNTDFTEAADGKSVTLTNAAQIGDEIVAVTFAQAPASTNDTVSKANGGTFEDGITIRTADNTAQLTLESTDDDAGIGPHQVYYRNSSSPADNDLLAEIDHRGRNDNSQDVDYATVNIFAEDVSDGTEDGKYLLQTMKAGATVSRMDVNSTETVFNDDSKDIDFRVESDGDANAFFVRGSDSKVAINNTDFLSSLHIRDTGANSGSLRVGGSGASLGLELLYDQAGSTTSTIQANPTYTSTASLMKIRVDGDLNTNQLVLKGDGIVGIGREPNSNDGGTGSLQLQGNDGMAMRRPSQTNSFILRPLASGDGMRFTQGGTGDRVTIDSSGRVNINAASASGGYSGYNLMVRGSSPTVKFESTNSNNTWDIYSAGGSHFYFAYNASDKGNINTSTGNYTATSDVNKKKDFENSDIGLEEVLQLQPKLFRMIEDESDAPKHLGFIAQEVQPIIPQSYVEETNDDRTFIGLQDRPIIAALTKAVQELSVKVDALEAQNTTQATQIADLITRVTALEAE